MSEDKRYDVGEHAIDRCDLLKVALLSDDVEWVRAILKEAKERMDGSSKQTSEFDGSVLKRVSVFDWSLFDLADHVCSSRMLQTLEEGGLIGLEKIVGEGKERKTIAIEGFLEISSGYWPIKRKECLDWVKNKRMDQARSGDVNAWAIGVKQCEDEVAFAEWLKILSGFGTEARAAVLKVCNIGVFQEETPRYGLDRFLNSSWMEKQRTCADFKTWLGGAFLELEGSSMLAFKLRQWLGREECADAMAEGWKQMIEGAETAEKHSLFSWMGNALCGEKIHLDQVSWRAKLDWEQKIWQEGRSLISLAFMEMESWDGSSIENMSHEQKEFLLWGGFSSMEENVPTSRDRVEENVMALTMDLCQSGQGERVLKMLDLWSIRMDNKNDLETLGSLRLFVEGKCLEHHTKTNQTERKRRAL
jgi:hypothetical protein